MEKEDIIQKIIDCAYEVRKHLYAGYLENVYQNALYQELTNNGMEVEKEFPLKVEYKGVTVGEYRCDLLVEQQVIVELKAVRELNNTHELQTVNYLTATGINDGLLINFGAEKLQIKHKYRTYKATKQKT